MNEFSLHLNVPSPRLDSCSPNIIQKTTNLKLTFTRFIGHLQEIVYMGISEQCSGVARAPQAPRPRGLPRGWRGPQGPARGPPGRSSRRNPLARGPNKLFAGGPENRRYATGAVFFLAKKFFVLAAWPLLMPPTHPLELLACYQLCTNIIIIINPSWFWYNIRSNKQNYTIRFQPFFFHWTCII